VAVPSISNISGRSTRLKVVSISRGVPDVVDGLEGVSLDVHIVTGSIGDVACLFNDQSPFKPNKWVKYHWVGSWRRCSCSRQC
jgi:hypothetical protein